MNFVVWCGMAHLLVSDVAPEVKVEVGAKAEAITFECLSNPPPPPPSVGSRAYFCLLAELRGVEPLLLIVLFVIGCYKKVN
jgi:hypothetical protein